MAGSQGDGSCHKRFLLVVTQSSGIFTSGMILGISNFHGAGLIIKLDGTHTMRISFERTGGFAALTLKATLDSEALQPSQFRRLQTLLEQSHFFDLPLKLEGPVERPDRFHYRLTVENNNCVHTVQASEDAVPTEMRPLLDWLTAAARKGSRG